MRYSIKFVFTVIYRMFEKSYYILLTSTIIMILCLC